MIVIGTDRPERYFARHSGDQGIKAARAQYEAWLVIARSAGWQTPEEIKASHPKASILKAGRVVFNIKGNDYRLIVVVQYKAGVLAIRFFGSHADYDQVNECGDGSMDATLIVIDSDAELARAQDLVERLMVSDDATDLARLEAQARLIEAYEESRWPQKLPGTPELLAYLMEQHGLTRADLAPLLGGPSRVSEVLNGKKGLSLSMIQRLRGRFNIPAELLLPVPRAA